jgi:hypothetical protein
MADEQLSGRESPDVERAVNELLLNNGWDYEDRKRVLFMLRNPKPRPRTMEECTAAIYRRYGSDLSAFFADAHAEVKARSKRRQLGGV